MYNFKIRLYDFLLFSLVSIFSILRVILFKERAPSVLVLLPFQKEGNLGDEAMLLSTLTFLKAKENIGKICILTRNYSFIENLKNEGISSFNIQNYAKYTSLSNGISLIKAAAGYSHFYCIGADVLDGFYTEKESLFLIKTTALLARMGLKTSIINFSFNLEPTYACAKALKRLPKSVRFVARDVLSKKRLEGLIDRKVLLGADIALLLEPSKDLSYLQQIDLWIKRQKECGRLVIGVNISFNSFQKIQGINKERIVTAYLMILNSLFSKLDNLSILFIPHDSRTGMNDLILAEGVYGNLPEKIKNYANVMKFPYGAADVKRICSSLDFVFSGRMHLAIACLSQGIPVMVVNYQDKAEGLYKYFDLVSLNVDPKSILAHEKIAEKIIDALSRKKIISEKINKNINNILTLAKNNFSNFPN